jgi:hypothetical protein
MFRISFLVDDKHLAPVLTSLTGKARDLSVVPVGNVEAVPNGRGKHRTENSYELFMNEVRKRGVKQMTPKDVKELLDSMGRSSSSYSHLLNRAMADRAIKKSKAPGAHNAFIYTVVPVK